MTERKSLSKKLRFEVFKRDSFTCQYCGRSAPDVILHVDHIKPICEGGDNDILNLVTSCADCNGGKGGRELSDDTAIKKKTNQLKVLQEKREQLDMMVEWQESLSNLDEYAVEKAVEYYNSLIGPEYEVNDNGYITVGEIVKQYGLQETLVSMKIAVDQYDDIKLLYVEKVAHGRKLFSKKPWMKELYYIRGIIRNRFNYHDPRYAIDLLKKAYEEGVDIDELKDMAINSYNWSSWKESIIDLTRETKRIREDEEKRADKIAYLMGQKDNTRY